MQGEDEYQVMIVDGENYQDKLAEIERNLDKVNQVMQTR